MRPHLLVVGGGDEPLVAQQRGQPITPRRSVARRADRAPLLRRQHALCDQNPHERVCAGSVR
ncbi:MAG: hypothetical protein M3348_16090, partial [Acidobacteriota bacterium]|nr:hypothetical protein [Acidobacteriota bacterium]